MSSFGFGGANAHAVLDDAFNYLRLRNLKGRHSTREIPPSPVDSELALINVCKSSPMGQNEVNGDAGVTNLPKLLIWTAFDESALKRMLSELEAYMTEHMTEHTSEYEQANLLEELTLTLSKRRSYLPCRTFVVAASKNALMTHLATSLTQSTRVASVPKLGFTFTGQGAHWSSMGMELLSFPVYKQSLQLATVHLHSLGCEWDILDEISASESTTKLDHPSYSQPICTALQVALVDLLASWGVIPSTVIGHSSGEIAAAYCAGAISRESAWDLAYYRGLVASLSRELSSIPFTMMAVGLSETEFQSYLDETQSAGGNVTIACYNSPQSITISGCEKRIDAIKQTLDDSGIFARKLKVDVAYHTSYMESVSSRYRELIRNITTSDSRSPKPKMLSSVTGMRVTSKQLLQSDYWVENMTSAVRFRQAVVNAFKQSEDAVEYLLEIGPHSALQGPLKQTLRATKGTESVAYSSMLIRGKPASETALGAMGQLFCRGFPVDIAGVNQCSTAPTGRAWLTDLPSYSWNHTKKYWLESRISKNYKFRKFPRHDLLGVPVSDWNPLEPRWRHTIRLSEKPWIGDHKVIQIYSSH